MGDYSLYCLDEAGKIASAELFDADDDKGAISLLRSQRREVDCEVWQGKRLVGRVSAFCP
jgi:hypothetical protein